jgi:hypothetical protein
MRCPRPAAVLAQVDRMSGAAGGMSFRRYMARRHTYAASSTSAFMQIYRSDPEAPNPRKVVELLDYLRQRGATDEMLYAARICWNGYLRSRRGTASRP